MVAFAMDQTAMVVCMNKGPTQPGVEAVFLENVIIHLISLSNLKDKQTCHAAKFQLLFTASTSSFCNNFFSYMTKIVKCNIFWWMKVLGT